MASINFLFFILTFVCARPLMVETLKLVNNGYEDFVVAVHRDIPEHIAYEGQIEYLLKEFSKHLYTATRHRAYIRSVTVVIPSTWRDDPKYIDPGEANFEHAQIRIDTPHPLHGDNPYTFQPGQCGEEGEYIHLTPAYVLDSPGFHREQNWGSPGKLLVHEFAHLRYGVFDEYGSLGDQFNPVFYLNDEARVVPSSCGEDVRGNFVNTNTNGPCSVNITTNLPETACDFFPDETYNPAIVSMMYLQYLENITYFCETNPTDMRLKHNEFAPNMHNRKCPQRGTWDVIKEHVDFKSGNTAGAVSNTDPIFGYVYNRRGYWQNGAERCGRRMVVLLDLSGSMRQNERWFKQTQTADKFIRDILPMGSNVGIVKFSTNATVWVPMTPLRNDLIKNCLANALPLYKDIGGNTGIGLALQEAMKMLNSTGGSMGGRILLITDGEETEIPRVSTLMNDIIASGVRVHTIAYGPTASSSLASLSQNTGGMYAYYSENAASSSLDSAIGRLWDDMAVCKERTPVEIYRTSLQMIITNYRYTGSVNVDDTVGLDTVFVFTLPRKAEITIQVLSPNSEVYDRNSNNFSHDLKLNIVRIRLQISVNDTGTWTYFLTKKSPATCYVGITVTSRSRDKRSTFEFRSWMSDLMMNTSLPSRPTVYAHVHKGYSPVIYANVSITIEKPGNQVDVVYPRDDGKDPDNVKNDGVYSAWVVSFTTNQRYSLDARVSNVPGKTAILVTGQGAGRTRSRSKRSNGATVIEPVGTDFTRTHSPGRVYIYSVTPGQDELPPVRVTDLHVRVVSKKLRRVAVSWTSPASTSTLGELKKYELRIGKNFDQMKNDFHKAVLVDELLDVAKNLPSLSPGETQELMISIPLSLYQSSYVFGIKTTGNAGHTSELSNLVTVTFESLELVSIIFALQVVCVTFPYCWL